MITKLHITRPHFESNDPRIRLPKDIWDWDVFQGPIRIRVTGGDPTGQRSVRTAFEGDYPERTIVTVDRLTKENEEAARLIEKVMALPLRRKAVHEVQTFSAQMPDFLAPEVKRLLSDNR